MNGYEKAEQALVFHHWEFEQQVRAQLGIFERPIFPSDAEKVEWLDLSNFDFRKEDEPTLSQFSGLKSLAICTRSERYPFLGSMPLLETLDLDCGNRGNQVDFREFRCLKRLRELYVSGGDYSNCNYVNLDALVELKGLCLLHLHEFGAVDLRPLGGVPWLTDFYCGYANRVSHVETIGQLKKLETLCLIDIEVDTLAFLDSLPDSLSLDLCGVEVRSGFDPECFLRFAQYEICEMTVGGKEANCELSGKSNA